MHYGQHRDQQQQQHFLKSNIVKTARIGRSIGQIGQMRTALASCQQTTYTQASG